MMVNIVKMLIYMLEDMYGPHHRKKLRDRLDTAIVELHNTQQITKEEEVKLLKRLDDVYQEREQYCKFFTDLKKAKLKATIAYAKTLEVQLNESGALVNR